LICSAGDRERIEDYASENSDGLRPYLPFAQGVPGARALRPGLLRCTHAGKPGAACRLRSSRFGSKTARGSKTAPDGTGALHLVPACASQAGPVPAQRAVDDRSNEINALPELPGKPPACSDYVPEPAGKQAGCVFSSI